MRIAFSGTGNSGKSETIRSFLYTWTQYKQPKKKDNIEDKVKSGEEIINERDQNEGLNLIA